MTIGQHIKRYQAEKKAKQKESSGDKPYLAQARKLFGALPESLVQSGECQTIPEAIQYCRNLKSQQVRAEYLDETAPDVDIKIFNELRKHYGKLPEILVRIGKAPNLIEAVKMCQEVIK